MNQINRKLHKALGNSTVPREIKEWEYYENNERYYTTVDPEDGTEPSSRIIYPQIPDYCADPRLVLKAMMERDDFDFFVTKINAFSLDEDGDLIDAAIPVDLIMDTTGELAKLAIEWLELKRQ